MSELFNPGTIGTISLKNRIVRSATEEMLASNEGGITDEYIRWYTRLAKGGVGLIITGNYGVNVMGRASPRTVLVDSDEVIGGLQKVVEAVHENGAKIVAQLNHVGRQRHPDLDDRKPVAPSPVTMKYTRVKPRAMTEGEIDDTIEAFGRAAGRIKEAGFDGIQMHGAHGYLINQFLSGHTNRRKDKWGGSAENRRRFLIGVYRATRSAVGPDFPVLIKINARDPVANGVKFDETIATCKILEELGINAIEVSDGIDELIKGGIPTDIIMRGRNLFQRIMMRFLIETMVKKRARLVEGYHLPDAAAVRKSVDVPVIAVGGIRRRAMMEHALLSGQADYVALSRPFIRQPNLVNRMQTSDEDPISCISCNRCALEMIVHSNPLRCHQHKVSE
jgi:2,4-dienoyl-CoA reductase-like NADH-dependent reductase (Old Yellow Enzyme family)